MNRKWRTLALVVVALSLSGCFLQIITGVAFVAGPGGDLITSVRTDSTTATCVDRTDVSGLITVECTYILPSDDGFREFVSTADLISEFGILGVVIDPLIAQIPDNATNIAVTYDDGAALAGDLVVQSGFKSIPIDIGRTLFAEPGQQFVIAELPAGVPFEGVTFAFELSFATPDDGNPVAIKPLLALKFDSGFDQVFHMPFLPCVDSMADVAAVTVPLSSTPLPLPLPALPVPCDGEQFFLLGFGVFQCDFDGDDDVDIDDLILQAGARGAPALPGDRLDHDNDGDIDINDIRGCVLECTLPGCARPVPLPATPPVKKQRPRR